MTVHSLYPVLQTADVERAAVFYAELLRFERTFTADWYVSLAAPGNPAVQLAFVDRGHPSIPDGFAAPAPSGSLVTVEVDDVDAIAARAEAAGLAFHVPLRDEPWGQRHFITADPDGLLVDAVTVIEPDERYPSGIA